VVAVNDRGNFGDPVCREASLPGMLPNHVFIRRDIYAIDLIAGHITVEPLNLRSHLAQHAA